MAATITSLMTAEAYRTSAQIASLVGSFSRYDANKESMLEVISMHLSEGKKLASSTYSKLTKLQHSIWNDVLILGTEYGFRNAQVSLLAPTGTISFMMGCDTTGIEPEIKLKKWKSLVGGGGMEIVNHSIAPALSRLGRYTASDIADIIEHVDKTGSVVGSCLQPQDLPIFDTALETQGRQISYQGHIKMMGSVQPFLSGAISKTVNMPEGASIGDITQAYFLAWELGVKALAIYRDNSKGAQPITSSEKKAVSLNTPVRNRLPETRDARIHKFEVDGHEGYINVGMYDSGDVGEVFIKMSKQGSTLGGVMDSLAVLMSMSLQYGVPLEVIVRKFIHTKFEPSGYTSNPKIPRASSLIDYLFRWLGMEFLSSDKCAEFGILDYTELSNGTNPVAKQKTTNGCNTFCPDCGGISVRSGTCMVCQECGTTSGCS